MIAGLRTGRHPASAPALSFTLARKLRIRGPPVPIYLPTTAQTTLPAGSISPVYSYFHFLFPVAVVVAAN